VNIAIANTNETFVDIPQCSLTISVLHGWSKICESVVGEDLLSTSTTDRCESLVKLKIDLYKREAQHQLKNLSCYEHTNQMLNFRQVIIITFAVHGINLIHGWNLAKWLKSRIFLFVVLII
jgi:hypothetical protein